MNINLTLIGQSISFFVFVFFCWKFVWPPIITALHERQKKIADGLAAAEQGAHRKQQAEEEAQKVIQEAKQQAQEIISLAQKRDTQMIEEAKETARTEGDRIKQAAQSEIEQEINRAKETLRAQVAAIAVSGAEKILQREVDASSHQAVLDELVSQV